MMPTSDPKGAASPRRPNWKLYLVIAACAAPVIASYFMYYFVRPDGRVNYGDLIEPQRPLPSLEVRELSGEAIDLGVLRGKWLMIMVAPGACDEACRDKLYHLRQVRLTTGKEKDRVERVWLIPDNEPLLTTLMREYDGTRMLRVDANALGAWLPGGTGTRFDEHIYLVDPLGNLMMRFPVNADPNRTRRDLSRLLRASRIG